MDAWRSPEPIGQAHLSDQATDLPGYPRPTATRARLPAPVPPEACPMPPNDGLRLDHRSLTWHSTRMGTADKARRRSLGRRPLASASREPVDAGRSADVGEPRSRLRVAPAS
jgi:hypothetical protein